MRHAVGTGTLSFVLVGLMSGCLEPARERALQDLQPIEGDSGSIHFKVEQGAAVIHKLASGSVQLFGQTPALGLSLRVDSDQAQDFELIMDNCMPDAALISEPELTVQENPSDRPTRKIWRFQLPAHGAFRLDIGPADISRAEPFRFALLSDVQDAVDRVDDVFARINQDPAIRFVVSTGDLTESGQRGQYARFREKLTALRVPLFSTIGNHDVGFTGDCVWEKEMGRHSFHFEFRGVAFSMLDTASATLDPLVYDRLDSWLDKARDQTHLVVAHVPVIDPVGVRNGSFRSRREAAKLLSRLARTNVDLTLYGHVHSYYAYSNAGIPAYISGGGGAIPERGDGVGRHFLTVDVSAASGVERVSLVRVDGNL